MIRHRGEIALRLATAPTPDQPLPDLEPTLTGDLADLSSVGKLQLRGLGDMPNADVHRSLYHFTL